MARVSFDFKKGDLVWISLIVVLVGVGFVVAEWDSAKAVFHSSDDVKITIDGVDYSLQNASDLGLMGGGVSGGLAVTIDSESNSLVANHAYKTQTAGFVYAVGSAYPQTNEVYVSSSSNPAGSISNQLDRSHLGDGNGQASGVSAFVPQDYYFEVTSGGTGTLPNVKWQPLVSGGENPIDQD